MYKAVKINDNVYWVGALDYSLRSFHGYNTQRGSTYNAYLILDKTITLVDTVKAPFAEQMIERIKSVIDPSKIELLISNHVEMDHSGSIPAIVKYNPKMRIATAAGSGVSGLRAHYGNDLNLEPIRTNSTLNIGERTFHFVTTPLLHWPDNMVTYEEHDKILYSNDGFGQHLCTNKRWDDEVDWSVIEFEAKKYYANILLCYGKEALKAVNVVKTLDIDMILPSHGVMYRKHVKDIIAKYESWATQTDAEDALIVYDSMWHSTEKMADAINESLTEMGIRTHFYDLKGTHPSDIISDLIDSKYVIVGSPTLNNQILPTVAAFLCYIKGLSPKNKICYAFGSYGWNNKGLLVLNKELAECGFKSLDEKGFAVSYIPNEEKLNELKLKIKTLIEVNSQYENTCDKWYSRFL